MGFGNYALLALYNNDAYQGIPESGRLKSRNALLAQSRDMPDYMSCDAFKRHANVIWFSSIQFWEREAGILNEIKGSDGPPKLLTMLQMAQMGNGLVRLGMSRNRLLNWNDLMTR